MRQLKRKSQSLFLLLCLSCASLLAQDKFNIRGVLPWHNFLSGPTSWNLEDYRNYLDECQKQDINFIGFHNYTGGGERYATYVEPMVKIEYKNILPSASFDNSLTARWGYLPMKVKDYAFNTGSVFSLPAGAEAFGSDASVTSATPREHYAKAQSLMCDVLKMAHERGIRMAMGFEFGVIPPEYFSLNVAGDCFFWPGEANMIPNPKNQLAIEIHHAALDDILESYPDIDYIWMWLNEHSFMGVNVPRALESASFAEAYKSGQGYFEEVTDQATRFIGVWALEYMKLTSGYLQSKGSKAKVILGGWGGGNQLSALLKGIDRALPKDVIFSCLNPDLGKTPQPEFLADIAVNRTVWAVPWLEGDHQLWHFQPRVEMMRDHVKLAAKQNLDGVIAIHWRTEEPRFNLKTFAHFAANKSDDKTVEQLYEEYLTEEMGEKAAKALTPLLAKMDMQQMHSNVSSPEYFAFSPHWGLLDEQNVKLREALILTAGQILKETEGAQRESLQRFIAMFRFELLLGEVDKAMMPAFLLKKNDRQTGKNSSFQDYEETYRVLMSAPIREMFDTYMERIHSRGELGVLSSLNQRVWREYQELKSYLETKLKK